MHIGMAADHGGFTLKVKRTETLRAVVACSQSQEKFLICQQTPDISEVCIFSGSHFLMTSSLKHQYFQHHKDSRPVNTVLARLMLKIVCSNRSKRKEKSHGNHADYNPDSHVSWRFSPPAPQEMGILSQRRTRIGPKTTKRVKMTTLIIVLIIVAAVTVFSVQNAIPVAISFLFWKFEASLAIVLFLCVLTGVAIGVIGASLFKKKLSRNKQTSIDRENTHAL